MTCGQGSLQTSPRPDLARSSNCSEMTTGLHELMDRSHGAAGPHYVSDVARDLEARSDHVATRAMRKGPAVIGNSRKAARQQTGKEPRRVRSRTVAASSLPLGWMWSTEREGAVYTRQARKRKKERERRIKTSREKGGKRESKTRAKRKKERKSLGIRLRPKYLRNLLADSI